MAPSLLEDWNTEVRQIGSEFRGMIQARFELVRLEAGDTLAALKRLVVIGLIMGVLAAGAWSMWLAAASEGLAAWTGMSRALWFVLVGILSAGGAAVLGWFGWLNFERDFTHLEQSLEELREDLVWFESCVKHGLSDAGPASMSDETANRGGEQRERR